MHHSAICQFEANNKALVEPLHKKIWLVLPWCRPSLRLHCRGTSAVHPTAGTGLWVATYLNTSIARLCMYLPCLLFMLIHSFRRSCFSVFEFVKIKHFRKSLFIMRRENKSTYVSADITQAYLQPTLLTSYSTLLETWLKPLVQL